MSSPPRDQILSSSPVSIRGGGSPILRRRDDSGSAHGHGEETPRPPRMSPTLARSFDPDRQRTMDVDMALQLSRARRETISSPVNSPYEANSQPSPVPPFASMLSPSEQHDINVARGSMPENVSDHDVLAGEDSLDPPQNMSSLDLRSHLDQTHDPSLLVSLGGAASHNAIHNDDNASSLQGLPTYQANVPASTFDFTAMESYATDEKKRLGLSSPTTRFSVSALKRPVTDTTDVQVDNLSANNAEAGPSDPSASPPRSFRQRKLSQSTPAPRGARKGIGGKMALFEGHSNEPLPGHLGQLLGQGSPAIRSEPSLDHVGGAPGPAGILNTGHDRPYRFSFYSNALSATIHSRSLSELPAEGQSFEDLFSGMASPTAGHAQTGSDASKRGGNNGNSGLHMQGGPLPPGSNTNTGYFAGTKLGAETSRIGGIVGANDYDGNTWWLDVTSPTDEEMKMLSKVFAIHPLTTEDIQMEETREKIELFRNYYFVCFRGFDQDPYSPTHLEPLNMYIIVFREGILSFHFHPTPHPQNVRRRIKQLRDYISVTSDWISYALIDDITDAFGPLIQSIEYEVDSIDELVLILKEAEQSDMLRRIGTCRKKVMGLLRLMGNKADVVKGLAKRCNENWRVAPTSDIGLYLSDIQDHLITMTQNLNHYEKILSRSHSNYLAQISIEMTDANNQINDVLSKLTALGTVLIPMNLVTGLWGMNVHVPGEGGETYTWFVSIIAGLAAFAFIGGYSTYKFMVGR